MEDVVIIGAGATGLTAARQLALAGRGVVVLEREPHVGGLATSLRVDGFALDFAGHRWVPKTRRVRDLLEVTLGSDLLHRVRSHVILINGRLFPHPLSLSEYIAALPAWQRWAVTGDALAHRAARRLQGPPANFEQHILSQFGRRVYRDYFGPHYLKATCTSPADLLPSYGERFVGSGGEEVLRAALGFRPAPAPQRDFYYPRLGSGQFWERIADEIRAHGGRIETAAEVTEVEPRLEGFILSTATRTGSAKLACATLISTMPLPDLVLRLRPPAGEELALVASRLRRLALVLVYLLVRRSPFLPNDTVYVPRPDVLFSLVEDFSYLSGDMAPPGSTAVMALINTDAGSDVWAWKDDELVVRTRRDLEAVGFPVRDDELAAAHVRRVADARADPRHDSRGDIGRLLDFVARLGIMSIGRQGTLTPLMSMDRAVEVAFDAVAALGAAR